MNVKEKFKKKLFKSRNRGYIRCGLVKSLLNIFNVPKGSDDIQVVNDATKSGLNQAVWVPNFFLPTVITLAKCITSSSWMSDVDMGEFLLNYTMDQALQPYAGLGVTELVSGDKGG